MKGLEKPYHSPSVRPRGAEYDDQFRYIDDRIEGVQDDPVETEEDENE